MWSCSGLQRRPGLLALGVALLPLVVRFPAHGSFGLVAAQVAPFEPFIGATAEIVDRFQQLKSLIDAKGHEVSDDMKGQLEAMQKQLDDLQQQQASLLATAASLSAAESLASGSSGGISWAASCLAMATESLGGKLSGQDFDALGRLAKDELPATDAAALPLFRMAAVCLSKVEEGASDADAATVLELRDTLAAVLAEGKQVGSPSTPSLPPTWELQAHGLAGEARVREMTKEMWLLLAVHAKRATKSTAPDRPPMIFLLAAIVPAVQFIRYIQQKWDERRSRKALEASSEASGESATTSKAAKRKQKKSD